MSLDSLEGLFIDQLKDMLHAEKQLVRALPRMAKAAASPELQAAITQHLKETQNQVQRLERVFREFDETPRTKVCRGMLGLVEEGKEILEQEGEDAVVDAALISAAQRVEHYEIAAYGCLITYAQLLGQDRAARLLQENLAEEEAADKKLTKIAEGGVNQEAQMVGAEGESEE
ncbi:MAG TPA: ferritin-like domain-containing protein [Gemmatimonadales bacterium]|nr:ferritin-like domain-containing protein [Gemmatimonadales bacterium]